MTLEADLYLDRISISPYLLSHGCKQSCGFESCEEWLKMLREDKAKRTDCTRLTPRIQDISKYFSKKECNKPCGFSSCEEWIRSLKKGGTLITNCPTLSPNFVYALEVVLSLELILPQIEITQYPVQGILGLHEINGAGLESPVLVTGNALATQEVLMAILSTTTAPFHFLFIDCLGHTVDMAMVYETFTSARLWSAIEENEVASQVNHRELILPGITFPLKNEMEDKTGWKVRVGPYCLGELPLFMGDIWSKP